MSIVTVDYFDRTLLPLSAARGIVSVTSYVAVIATNVGIANGSSSLLFLFENEFAKVILKRQ